MNTVYDDEQDDLVDDGLFDSQVLQLPLKELPEHQPVVELELSATVRDAINQMVEKRVGVVVIVNGGKVAGVFSERDVLRKVAGQPVDIDTTPVSELMTAKPTTLHEDSPMVYALHQMALGGYRHVPLIDEHGAPVAVVSMRDIVGYIVSLYPDEVLKLPAHPDNVISQTREGA